MNSVSHHHSKLLFLVILLLIACLLYVVRQPILVRIGSYPILHQDPIPSDLVVAISGGLPEINYAIDLYHKRYASKILFIGNFPVELAVLSEVPFAVTERRTYHPHTAKLLSARLPLQSR